MSKGRREFIQIAGAAAAVDIIVEALAELAPLLRS